MKFAVCLGCAYLQFNTVMGKWECTRPGWRRYIDNPGTPLKCSFFKRRKEGEKIKILTPLRVKSLASGGS
ncbi:MAG: hypothetical protein QXU45_08930 [Candidatus Bathyarchaeia archaeon]